MFSPCNAAQQVAYRARTGATRIREAPGSEHASRSESEPVSAPLHNRERSVRQIVMKPATGGEAAERAATGLSGVRGDKRVWKDRPRDLGEPAGRLGAPSQLRGGINNSMRALAGSRTGPL